MSSAARAANDAQSAHVGKFAGGRVGLFLETDDFDAMHAGLVDREPLAGADLGPGGRGDVLERGEGAHGLEPSPPAWMC